MGTGKVLLPSELPTLRSVLREGVLYKEQHIIEESTRKQGRTYNYSMTELVEDMMEAVKGQWTKANDSFQHPVIVADKTIKDRLKQAWEVAQKIAQNKSNARHRKIV